VEGWIRIEQKRKECLEGYLLLLVRFPSRLLEGYSQSFLFLFLVHVADFFLHFFYHPLVEMESGWVEQKKKVDQKKTKKKRMGRKDHSESSLLQDRENQKKKKNHLMQRRKKSMKRKKKKRGEKNRYYNFWDMDTIQDKKRGVDNVLLIVFFCRYHDNIYTVKDTPDNVRCVVWYFYETRFVNNVHISIAQIHKSLHVFVMLFHVVEE
jgi:hypothetical protein